MRGKDGSDSDIPLRPLEPAQLDQPPNHLADVLALDREDPGIGHAGVQIVEPPDAGGDLRLYLLPRRRWAEGEQPVDEPANGLRTGPPVRAARTRPTGRTIAG